MNVSIAWCTSYHVSIYEVLKCQNTPLKLCPAVRAKCLAHAFCATVTDYSRIQQVADAAAQNEWPTTRSRIFVASHSSAGEVPHPHPCSVGHIRFFSCACRWTQPKYLNPFFVSCYIFHCSYFKNVHALIIHYTWISCIMWKHGVGFVAIQEGIESETMTYVIGLGIVIKAAPKR
jgi:hypothetical protein